MVIEIEPVQAVYDSLQKRLDSMGKSDSMKSVMRSAINEVTTSTKEKVHSETRGMYTIKASSFRKSDIKQRNATDSLMQAILTVSGPTLGIRKGYKTRKNSTKKGASAMVKTAGAMKELNFVEGGKNYRAFLATMSSGHVGIFQRVPGKKMRKKAEKEAIKEIMSLSRAKAAEVAYREKISMDTEYDLNYSLLKHMNAVIGE